MNYIKLTNTNFIFKLESVVSIEFETVTRADTKKEELNVFIALEGGHAKVIRDLEDIEKIKRTFGVEEEEPINNSLYERINEYKDETKTKILKEYKVEKIMDLTKKQAINAIKHFEYSRWQNL